MPAKANDTIHFVSGGDSGIGKHAVMTNHVAAAQSPMFVVIAGDIAYENGKSPAIFFQFLKNYSRDLRDDKKRLIPLLGCLGNHEAVGGYGKTRKEAPFFYSVFDGLFPETGYASLDFGDYLSLIFLDTGHTSPIEGAQTDWLARNAQRAGGMSRRCLPSITCRRTPRTVPCRRATTAREEREPVTASTGFRCSSVTTSTPFSSTTTTRTSARIPCWTAA